MVWVRIDDSFFENPKIRRAGKDGRELYLAALCYSSHALTDGHIHADDVAFLAVLSDVTEVDATVARLVRLHLWEVTDVGYQIHDYLQYNLAKADVLHIREIRTEVGTLGGKASGIVRRTQAEAKTKQIASGLVEAKTNPNPNPNPVPIDLIDLDPADEAKTKQFASDSGAPIQIRAFAVYEEVVGRPVANEHDADLLLSLCGEEGEAQVIAAIRKAGGNGKWKGHIAYLEAMFRNNNGSSPGKPAPAYVDTYAGYPNFTTGKR